MSVELDFVGSPVITVIGRSGRPLDFEVDRHGDIEITVEVDDLSGWSGPRPMDVTFWMSAEDWAAVVAHIARNSAALGQHRLSSEGE